MNSKNENNSSEKQMDNKNELPKNNDIDNNNNINNTDNNSILLNKKTKPETDLLNIELSPDNNKQKKLEKEPEKINQIYEYNYTIKFLETEEEGLMEDFLKDNPLNSDQTDYYNYGYTPESFKKIIFDSLLYHYEEHLKREKEKRENMQNMWMFNMNINMNMNNMGNNIIPRGINTQMNPMNNMMINNMNNHNNYNYNINDNNNKNEINQLIRNESSNK
jgi:hypothetical protein